jgi:Histidine kinase-, DNA gyrase B-, and HSP90-like ATPase
VTLLREALTANQGYAARSSVTLLLEERSSVTGLLENVGRAIEPEVALDADRFLQVMANLLSNAIKHSPAGETVRVSLQQDASGLRVTVRDRGPGVTPAFRERLFEKFSQADGSDRRAQGGTGLGLYITRMLVERMGGRITADDVSGEGSAFSLHFPPAAAVVPALPAVLLVDADFETRERVARWLAPAYRVEGAATLAQAEVLAPQTAPVAFVGNPQSQGSADAFCSGLRRLAAGRPILLLGDSIDAAFSASAGLPWLDQSSCSAEALQSALRALLQRPPGVSGPK